MKKLVFLSAFALLFILGCNSATVEVEFYNQDRKLAAFTVEVVSNIESRAKGLMFRHELADDAGMLFVFPGEAPRSFWMRNTYIPLDMVFLNREKKVVSVIENATPLTEDPRPSGAPAMYVLEIKGGKAKEYGLLTGTEMKILKQIPLATE